MGLLDVMGTSGGISDEEKARLLALKAKKLPAPESTIDPQEEQVMLENQKMLDSAVMREKAKQMMSRNMRK